MELIDPPRIPRLTKWEMGGLAIAAGTGVASWLVRDKSEWALQVLAGAAITIGAGIVGSFLRNWRWRAVLGQKRIDPNAVVYVKRDGYTELLRSIGKKNEVIVLGYHLGYITDWLQAAPSFFNQVDKLTLLLPSTQALCDGRDASQGTEPGELWERIPLNVKVAERIAKDHPGHLDLKFFTIEPFCSFTKADDEIWAVPYLAMTGYDSPILYVNKQRSPELFQTLERHITRMVSTAAPHPEYPALKATGTLG